MPSIDLKYAFGLKPEKAVEYFRAKGFRITWDWHEMLEEAHARAFTVAKAMRTDILQDIHGELVKALDEGTAFADWKKNLVPRLKAKGWWGEVVNEATGEIANVGPHRLRTIYETNIQTSYMVGHYRRMMENAADRPWWLYVAVMDKRTRPAHAALNGLTFRFDDPFWDTHYPPSGFRCRCSVRALTDDGLESKVKAGEAARRSTVGPDADATLEKVEKPLDREGQRMYQAVTVKTTGLNGEKIAMAPDPGWSYNPGKAWQKPFVPQPMDPGDPPVTSLGSGAAARPIEQLPAKPLTKDMFLPPHQESGWSEEEYIRKFLGEFGADIGKPVVFKDIIDDALVISEDLFLDRKENRLKVFRADREVYLKVLADTIKDPVEIWLTPVEAIGKQRLCKRYVGLYRNEKQKLGGFVVFDLVDGMWQGTTAFRPRNLVNLDKQRVGALLYTKK